MLGQIIRGSRLLRHTTGLYLSGCQGIDFSMVALYFSFFILWKAADIEIFKDFTRAKNGKEQVNMNIYFLTAP